MSVADASALVLDVQSVSKTFGTLQANDEITMQIRSSTVHALLGENGAGKSTLVKIINGLLLPDSGEIHYLGERIRTHNVSVQTAGIATVHQELALVPVMTGLENIALALRVSNNSALRSLAAEVQEQVGTTVPLDVPVGQLELPQRQRIELIKALCRRPRLLLLDEPTTFLPPTDTGPFLAMVRLLADEGMSVLLITHRLEEATEIADEATVIRRGRVVGEHPSRPLPNADVLASEIVGLQVPVPSRQGATLGEVVLTTTGLTVEDSGHRLVDSVNLELRRGEILGIAGVDGNGQLELLESIAGLRRVTSGSVVLNGVSLGVTPYARRSRLGLQLVSGDRRRDGIVPTFTIAEHFQYMLGRSSLTGLKELLQQFDVRPPSPLAIADELSGGNQQKMVMARALKRPTEVLMVSYPTQGLDVMATAQLQQILLHRADLGTAVIVLSSDLEELLQICDSIAVMNGGAVIGTQRADRFDRDELAAWYTSRSATTPAASSPGAVAG